MKALICLAAGIISLSSSGQGVKISAAPGTPAPSSILDLESASKGFLPPRLTTAERDQIQNAAEGLVIYNLDEQCLNLFAGSSWKSLCGCDLPAAVTLSGSGSVNSQGFTIQWNVANWATGYLLDVSLSSDFSSYVSGYHALAVGNVLSYTVNGLAPLTTYYFRVRAVNNCGSGAQSASMNQATIAPPPFACGSSSVTISHNVSDGVSPVSLGITYNTVSYINRCWLDKNLGATVQPSSALDAGDAAAGWYWQFNRAQGYAVGPVPAVWNTAGAGAGNWAPANDPCTILAGSNWRIPTSSEWTTANTSWSGYNSGFSSPLKLHAAGNILLVSNGSLNNRAYSGRYWSSNEFNTTLGLNLHLGSNASQLEDTNDKAHGFSIRCILNQ